MFSITTILLVLLPLLAASTYTTVYELNQISNFRNDQMTRVLGCGEPAPVQFAVGAYTHTDGVIDTLKVMSAPHIFQLNPNCLGNRQQYRLIYGPDEDYDELLRLTPQQAMNEFSVAVGQRYPFVINWHYPLKEKSAAEIAKSKEFLTGLLKALQGKAYLRVPASSICFSHSDEQIQYLTDVKDIEGFIVEMYGPGSQYTTYESHFTETTYSSDPNHKEGCPSSPSLTRLKQLLPDKKIFIAKPLRLSVEGYVSNFDEYAKRAEAGGINLAKVFYTDYKENMIRL